MALTMSSSVVAFAPNRKTSSERWCGIPGARPTVRASDATASPLECRGIIFPPRPQRLVINDDGLSRSFNRLFSTSGDLGRRSSHPSKLIKPALTWKIWLLMRTVRPAPGQQVYLSSRRKRLLFTATYTAWTIYRSALSTIHHLVSLTTSKFAFS